MFRQAILFIFLLGFSWSSVAQVDTTLMEIPEEIPSVSKARPMIGFGVGTFAFYGDTGKNYRSNNPFTSSLALSFTAQIPVNYFLDVNFSGVMSSVTVNEPGLRLNNNFKSEITGGSAILSYNFENFLPKGTFWQPYIGTGISSFEFLSKSDLLDANGNEYHIWSDGQLMSLPENASNASEAIMVERDYVYETDLRELNRESQGDYPDRTLSIPISAGINFKFSKHLKGQLGTTLFFNMNDLVDDVESDPSRSDGKKDKFLHTSLSMSYDLYVKSKKKPSFDVEFEDGEELIAFEYWDVDEDGVPDLDDDCLGHPKGIEVDGKGCPLDEDEDGVPDYKDDEPMTLEGALVNEFGETIEDDVFLQKYMVWIDSLGVDELYSRVDGEKSKKYSVLILPDKDGMNQDEINSLLAENDVRSVDENGEQGFLVGDFESLPEAVNKKLELQKQGLEGSIQKEKDGVREDIDDEIGGMSEIVEERNRVIGAPETSDQLLYRVQVGAFKYDLSNDIFSNINDLLVLTGDDGLTRYMTESYETAEEAAKRRVDLLTDGFEDAFITAYQKGERITLATAGMKLTKDAQDLVYDKENNSINPKSITFQIQLGEFVNDIPTETLEKFLELEKVRPVKDELITRYMYGEFKDYEAAKVTLKSLKEQGMEKAEIKGTFNGKVIPLEEALNILGGKDHSYIE